MTHMQDRQDTKEHLERGDTLHYHVWTFTATCMSCSEGCCDDGFPSVEETLDYIDCITDGEWDKVYKTL